MKRAIIVRLLRHMQNEYAVLRSTPFSLESLFSSPQFQIGSYCKPFQPHPQTQQIAEAVQDFAKPYGIWLPQAQHYVTCSMYLFPTATFERIMPIARNNVVDFYCNDIMGRDMFGSLSEKHQHRAAAIIERIVHYDEQLQDPADTAPIERANLEMLRSIRDNSPQSWFQHFLQVYNYHMGTTHRDNNAASLLSVPTVEGYIEQRKHTSGMLHILLLIEYSQGVFLDWNWLQLVGMDTDMKRLHRAAALFGCLSNDLFSFGKEVIGKTTDANLLAIIALNHSSLSLEEVVVAGANIVRDELVTYATTLKQIEQRCQCLTSQYPVMVNTINTHLTGIARCVQASWMWQVYTKRYKSENSIWKETQLVE